MICSNHCTYIHRYTSFALVISVRLVAVSVASSSGPRQLAGTERRRACVRRWRRTCRWRWRRRRGSRRRRRRPCGAPCCPASCPCCPACACPCPCPCPCCPWCRSSASCTAPCSPVSTPATPRPTPAVRPTPDLCVCASRAPSTLANAVSLLKISKVSNCCLPQMYRGPRRPSRRALGAPRRYCDGGAVETLVL